MNTWTELIYREKQKTYLVDTYSYIQKRKAQGIEVFPQESDIFTAFELTPLENVKVVILGQDPYHGAGQAHGLCFSVNEGITVPPSLRNIYKELAVDIDDFVIPMHGNLTSWAKQGVLMLNTVLTVEAGEAHSHKKLGWEKFTDVVIDTLNQQTSPIIFILWGAHAQKKGKHIDQKKHKVLAGPHPSPLSAHRGFFGCRHFSQANQYLVELGKSPIDWKIS